MNNINQANKVLIDFLANNGTRVMALKGPWGVGKSYFVREFLKQDSPHLPSFTSYVSLFGVSSIQQAQDTIIDCMVGDEGKMPKIVKQMFKAAKLSKFSLFGFSFDLPDLTKAIFWRIAKRTPILIVLDDLERKNDQLKMDQILGLASSISENTQAKFLLIFNEENIGAEADSLSRYREKVIDVEFTYKPNPQELATRFLEQKDAIEVVNKCLEVGGGPNIRIIRHVNRTIAHFKATVAAHNDILTKTAVADIATTTCLFFLSPIPLTVESFGKAWLGSYKNDESPSEAEEKLAGYIRTASLRLGDISHLVIDYLRNGYIDAADLISYLSDKKRRGEEEEISNRLTFAYKPYTDNFIANASECTAPVEKVLDEYAGKIGLETMARNCEFLEYFDRPTDWLWRKHVTAKAPNLSPQTLSSYLKVLKDEESKQIVLQHLNSASNNIDVPEMVNTIVEKQSWHPDDMKRMALLPDEYYLGWFRSERGDFLHVLRSFLHICSLKMGGPEQELATKLKRVMKQLAHENPATAIRLAKFFEIPENDASFDGNSNVS